MSTSPKSERLLTPAEAAAYLGMPMAEFKNLCRRRNAPPVYRLGDRMRRYSASELEAWRNPVPALMAHLLSSEHRNGWIYFLQAEDLGTIKIGYATTVSQRVADIRGASPVWLEFLGAFPGCMNEEAILHKYFAEDRMHGEWFRPAPVLLDLIREITPQFRGKYE